MSEAKSEFKVCTTCGYHWKRRRDFLSDPTVNLLGYQANFKKLEAGFFLFNHDLQACGTSMAIAVEEFIDLHEGPVFEEHLCETKTCPRHCLNFRSLDVCPNKCECSYVRDVIQVVKTWPKRG